jgi:hypothetical protein
MPDPDEYNAIDALDRILYGLAGAGIATILLAIGYAIGRYW